MLLSMTGFGEASDHSGPDAVSVEIRAVNNRHLKVTVRGSDPYPMLESDIDKVIRRHVKRGTLLVQIRVERSLPTANFRLNVAVLENYLRQIREVARNSEIASILSGALALPGVVPQTSAVLSLPEDEWPVVEKTLERAIGNLNVMRRGEGDSMAAELLEHHRAIGDWLERVRLDLPAVMVGYRQRLLERVNQAVSDAGVTIEIDQLIREVALFADRIDVSEEITRLDSHLDLFSETVRRQGDGLGRKLEFVVQEMAREVNTLGSKAGDVTISRSVVEIKATLEKIRELVQNIE